MARTGVLLPLILAFAAALCVQQAATFIGARQAPALRSAAVVARHAAEKEAAAKSSTSDFDLSSFSLEPVDEKDTEKIGYASAALFGILGFAWVPVLKGVTCGLVFAGVGYFGGSGELTKFIGKSEGAKDYMSTANTVESVTAGVGGYAVKAYNFVVGKVKELKK